MKTEMDQFNLFEDAPTAKYFIQATSVGHTAPETPVASSQKDTSIGQNPNDPCCALLALVSS